jgi:hypothetical protein
MALFPPQEMLPPESLFCTLPDENVPATNCEHLFGFTPCVFPKSKENSINTSHEQAMTESQYTDNFYATCEDFSTLFPVEEFASFL